MNKEELKKHIKEITSYLTEGSGIQKEVIEQHEGAIELMCIEYSQSSISDEEIEKVKNKLDEFVSQYWYQNVYEPKLKELTSEENEKCRKDFRKWVDSNILKHLKEQ